MKIIKPADSPSEEPTHSCQNANSEKCPVPVPSTACDYQTDDLDAVIVAALITAHSVTHANATSKKVDKLKRPTISTSGTSEEW